MNHDDAVTLAPPLPYRAAAVNPFRGIDIGERAVLALADLDGDGDLDLVVGGGDGSLNYYRNTGGILAPRFEAQTGANNPLGGGNADAGNNSSAGTANGRTAPVPADLDRDGDLDLVVGKNNGNFDYYKNTGSATAPSFVLQRGENNPLNGLDAGDDVAPALADLDRDGDLDLVAGTGDGSFRYYQNVGNAAAALFVQQQGEDNPFNGVDAGAGAAPALADLDDDGDLDLLAGTENGLFSYYENTGDARSPAFTSRTGVGNPLNGVDAGEHAAPAFAALDGDRDLELAVGIGDGTISYYRVFAPRALHTYNDAGWVERTDFDDDNDGAIDRVEFYSADENGRRTETRGADLLSFFAATAANPFSDVDVGRESAPTLADLDSDGDLDLLAGENDGRLNYYRQEAPGVFAARTGANNPFNGIDVGVSSRPALADLDGDGDLDLLVGGRTGFLRHFRNTGNATAPRFSPDLVRGFVFSDVDLGEDVKPAFGDVDDDGDLDLVAGVNVARGQGELIYYENTGTAAAVFTRRSGAAANPFHGIRATGPAPTLVDRDRDGDLDLVIGKSDGSLVYYENTGVAGAPAFTQRTGAANPVTGVDVGNDAVPAFGDLDGDGLPELVVGRDDDSHAGTFSYYQSRYQVITHRETYARNTAGDITRTDFDDDNNGTTDRTETYARNAAGDVIHTRYDDDNDGLYDRYVRWGADGATEIAISFQYNGNGQLTGYDVDRNGDGAADAGTRIARNADGYRIQVNAADADSAASRRIHYYDETGMQRAVGRNLADEHRMLDNFAYASLLDVITSEIRDSVEHATVGLVDANDLVGVPQINLAGARIGRSDFTISNTALSVMAGGDGEYQLQIEGDLEDVLRFDMDDFTEGNATGEEEGYRLFTSRTDPTRSFIVNPDVTVLDIGAARPARTTVGTDVPDEAGTVIGTGYDDNGDDHNDRAYLDPDRDGTVDRVESYTYFADGRLARTRIDDGADGTYDRYRIHREAAGKPDIVISYLRDGNGRLVRRDADQDGDETADFSIHFVRNAAGAQIQVNHMSAGSTAASLISYFNEAGDLLARGSDSDDDPDAVLNGFFYSTLLDIASEIRPSVANPAVGLMDARLLAGVPRIVLAGAAADRTSFTMPDDPLNVLAGASIGSTDLTLSNAALGVLANGDGDYQLQIDGGWEDVLRFDMDDFTEGNAVAVGEENYRLFTSTADTTRSFIVDPDVALIDI